MSVNLLLVILCITCVVLLVIIVLLINGGYSYAGKHTEKQVNQNPMTPKQILKDYKPYVPQFIHLSSDGVPGYYSKAMENAIPNDKKDNKATGQETSPKVSPSSTSKDKAADSASDINSSPATDVLVNADGEPILTKDLTRPSFDEVANSHADNGFQDNGEMDHNSDLLQKGEVPAQKVKHTDTNTDKAAEDEVPADFMVGPSSAIPSSDQVPEDLSANESADIAESKPDKPAADESSMDWSALFQAADQLLGSSNK